MTTQKSEKALKTTGKKAAKPAAPKSAASQEASEPKARRVNWARGVVVSDKMNKTRVVRLDIQSQEKFYKKFVVRSKKYKAHDEKNDSREGDIVRMIESRPLSREKRWVITQIVRRSGKSVIKPVDIA